MPSKIKYTTERVQAIIFQKKYFTKVQSLKWVLDHGMMPIKPVHEMANFYRYRLIEPIHFKTFRTIKIDRRIKFVIGFA